MRLYSADITGSLVVSGSLIVTGSTAANPTIINPGGDDLEGKVFIVTGSSAITRDLTVGDDFTVKDETKLEKEVKIGYQSGETNYGVEYQLNVTASQGSSYSANFDGDVLITGSLVDKDNATGTAGQVLSSTGTQLQWVVNDGAGITGTGTIGTIPKFTASTVLDDSIITEAASAITVAGAATFSGNVDIIKTTSDAAGELRIGGILASDDLPFGIINFANTAAANSQVNDILAYIAGEKTGSSNTADLTFATSNNAAPTERLRITSGGNVGIGINPTLGKVQIEQGGDTNGLVINNTTAHPPKLYLRDAGSNGYSEIIANNDLYLNAPNVGIGTDSPSYKLEVNGGTALVGGGFYVSNDQTINTSSLYTFRDGVYINNPNSTSAIATSNSVMSIGASSGNSVYTSLITTGAIGIGTNSPSARLTVASPSSYSGSTFRLETLAGASSYYLDFVPADK